MKPHTKRQKYKKGARQAHMVFAGRSKNPSYTNIMQDRAQTGTYGKLFDWWNATVKREEGCVNI